MKNMSTALCAVFLLLVSSISQADDSQSEIRFVNLDSGLLHNTLPQISRLFSVSIVARSELIPPLKVPKISGRFELPELLHLILKDTGLSYRKLASGYLIETPDSAVTHPDHVEQIVVVGKQFHLSGPYSQDGFYSALGNRLSEEAARIGSVEVLSMAALQSLPFENLAESLQYLPGVSLNRERGEGLSLSIRGLGPQYQSILLNGHAMAINENVRTSGQGGRQFRFDVLPAENLARVEVLKSASGTGPIGSEVNIFSFRPLQTGRLPNYLRSEWEYQPQADKTYPTVSGMAGWRNNKETFGFLMGAQYRERYHYQDQYQTWSWDRNQHSWNNPSLNPDTLVPSNRFALTNEQEQRERQSVTSSVQWNPVGRHIVTLDYFRSDLSFDFREERLLARLDAEGSEYSHLNYQGNALLAGRANDVYLQSSLDTSRQFHKNTMWMADYQWSDDSWDVLFSYARSFADSYTDEPIRRTVINTANTAIDFSAPGSGRSVKFLPSLDVLNPESFVSLDKLTRRDIDLQHRVSSFRLAMTHNLFLDGWLQRVKHWKTDLVSRRQRRSYQRRDVSLHQPGAHSFSPYLSMTRLQTEHFLAGMNNNLVTRWLVPTDYLQQQFNPHLQFTSATEEDRQNSYQVEEQVDQWLQQLNVNVSDGLSAEIGLNVSSVKLSSSGFRIDGSASQRHDNHFLYWLPTLNLLYQPLEFWQSRAHYSRAVSLPNYHDLTTRLSLNSTDGVFLASGGNPLLKPVVVDQYELSISFLPDTYQRFDVALFAKNMNGFVTNQADNEIIQNQVYRVTVPGNNGRATILGGELSYDLAAIDWGVQFTATLVDSEVKDNDEQYPIEAVSPISFSTQAYCSAAGTRFQLGLSYRSDYLLEKGQNQLPDVYVQSNLQAQAQLSWDIGRNSSIALTGTNLLNSQDVSYFTVAENRIYRSLESSGSRYAFLFNVNF